MIKLLFASATEPVVNLVAERLAGIYQELDLVVVSEFKPVYGEWIPYHILRTPAENEAMIRARIGARGIRFAAIIHEPRTPHKQLRRLGLRMAPLFRLMIFNENGDHFLLRPDHAHQMARYALWRTKNLVRSQTRPGGTLYERLRILRNPEDRKRSLLYRKALKRGRWLAANRPPRAPARLDAVERPDGISVVIPSRNGLDLLRVCLPRLEGASEILIVDNGSNDGTAKLLSKEHPQVLVDVSPAPLSFARAVNRGIQKARFSHVCLLNNDMLVEPGFLTELRKPFDEIPDLFSSSAQIFFPEGQRREETGKTVLLAKRPVMHLPLSCEVPLEGEDRSWVLYGSGGCTLYDARKLAALGNFDEAYEPAYVEDLDVGFRAWLAGWPSVYAAGARVLHKHRTTTSRYFKPEDLDFALEANYARFLERAVPDIALFSELWRENTLRLKANQKTRALEFASKLDLAPVAQGSADFLPLVNGHVSLFPGRAKTGKPVVLVASPYLPYPLSHGAAVRIYNLMKRAARDFDQILVAFVESPAAVPRELLEFCTEVIIVARPGTHALPSTSRPETVEEFDRPSFHQALQWAVKKWQPRIAQLEFTQMAMYAPDCAPAKTLLVEHDITYDLYAQMLSREEDFEIRRQYERWVKFERRAWTEVTRVVTMSAKDSALVQGSVVIPNGVDLERFRPSVREPEPRRLLFIGSFAHKPNVLAVEFFLNEVFPKLRGATLHVIAGQRHTRFWDLQHEHVEVEGFVSDVRTAYERAAVVIAPLVASAGTNIKIMEAMAMGKAIVSTQAGIHGLDALTPGTDLVVEDDPSKMAAAISELLDVPAKRRALEQSARLTAERVYGWDAIAQEQKRLYESLLT